MPKILRFFCLIIIILLLLLFPNSGLAQTYSYDHRPADSPFQLEMVVEVSGATVTRQYREGIFNVIEGTIQPGGDVTVTIKGSARADFNDCPQNQKYPSVAYANYIYPGNNLSAGKNNQRTGEGMCHYGFNDSVSYQYRFNENDLAKGIEINGWIGIKYAYEEHNYEKIRIKCKFSFADGGSGPSGPSEPPSQDFSIELIPEKLSLELGEEKQIKANITAPGIDSPSLVWESSDPSIATVDNNGIVKAVGMGQATIRAFLQERMGVNGSAVVDVAEMPSISIARKPSGNRIAVGEEFKLEAKVTNPNNYSNVGWDIVTGNSAVISRDSGVLKGIALGFVTVRAYLYISDGKYIEDIVDIEIVEDYWITLSPGKLTLQVEETGSIEAIINWPFEKVQGVQYKEPDLSWEVLNTEIVAVNVKEDGKVGELTALKEGNTTVVVNIEGNSSIIAFAEIEVTEEEIAINKVSFNPPCLLIGVGSSSITRAIVEPADATEELLFRSINMNIATTEKIDDNTVQLTGNLAYDTTVEAYVIRSGKAGQPDQEIVLGKLPVAVLPESGAIRIALFSAQPALTALYQDYRDKGFYLKPGEALRLIGVFQNAEAHWDDKRVEWTSSNQDVINIINEYRANPVFREGNARSYCSRNYTPFNELGNIHPVAVIQADENISEISSASVTVRSAGNLTDTFTVWVVPASHEKLWKEIVAHSDQQAFKWFKLNRAANIPPPIKLLISSPAWKALDYHPKKWILNVFIELLMGNRTSAIKEILVGNIGPAAQAIDHLLQALLGEDYPEKAEPAQHNPEYTPIDYSPITNPLFPDSGELIQR